jgi:uncharacterized protein
MASRPQTTPVVRAHAHAAAAARAVWSSSGIFPGPLTVSEDSATTLTASYDYGMDLSASELRVLGCLLEKQRTTPDIYPLSLNSLRLACNQSTNRDPVVAYDDTVLRDALHRLERRGYTRLASGPGSRAPKYRHLLAEALPMAEDEQAVVTVLMLRGPQTPGELKQRTERMHAFADLGGVLETLERLIARELVARLERRPGQKEERYEQLLGDDDAEDGPAAIPAATSTPTHASMPARAIPAVDSLEERVALLEREVGELRAALGDVPSEGGGEERREQAPRGGGGEDQPEGHGEDPSEGCGEDPSEIHRDDKPEHHGEAQPEETLEWT